MKETKYILIVLSMGTMLGMVETGPQLAQRIQDDIKRAKTFDQIYENIDDLISFQPTISPTKFDEVMDDVLDDAFKRVQTNINNAEQRIAIRENFVTGLETLAARVMQSYPELYTKLIDLKNRIANLLAPIPMTAGQAMLRPPTSETAEIIPAPVLYTTQTPLSEGKQPIRGGKPLKEPKQATPSTPMPSRPTSMYESPVSAIPQEYEGEELTATSGALVPYRGPSGEVVTVTVPAPQQAMRVTYTGMRGTITPASFQELAQALVQLQQQVRMLRASMPS